MIQTMFSWCRYSLDAVLDAPLLKQLVSRKLFVGQKLRVTIPGVWDMLYLNRLLWRNFKLDSVNDDFCFGRSWEQAYVAGLDLSHRLRLLLALGSFEVAAQIFVLYLSGNDDDDLSGTWLGAFFTYFSAPGWSVYICTWMGHIELIGLISWDFVCAFQLHDEFCDYFCVF